MRDMLNRRSALASGLAQAIASPLPATAAPLPPKTRAERIHEHAKAIVALLREEIPGDHYDRIQIFAGTDWGPARGSPEPGVSLRATTMATVWQNEPRVRDGGFWAQFERDDWTIRGDGEIQRYAGWRQEGAAP